MNYLDDRKAKLIRIRASLAPLGSWTEKAYCKMLALHFNELQVYVKEKIQLQHEQKY